MVEKLLSFGEYAAAGLYETPSRSLFYRCSLGIRRYYENCSLAVYRGELLYPSGKTYQTTGLFPQCVNALSYGSLARWEGEKAPLAKKIAKEFNLKDSGGSDFHGERKPGISLATGKGNLIIPYEFCKNLRP